MLISVKNVSKIYPKIKSGSSQSLISIIRGKEPLSDVTETIAVSGVSLEIESGQRVGIIGNNGAGKTTLLQMIAGLSTPTSGSIQVEGHVNCIMTLGIGLREELSGRENIYIDGELNGKSREQTDQVIDEIVNFAELGTFIDRPVRTYSSGMKARLAFSMIIFIEPEILIIDEALSAGDVFFGSKATAKMKEISSKGKILMVVSHSMGTIVDMCNRCVWLEHGRIVMDGPPKEVTDAFIDHVRTRDETALKMVYKKRLEKQQYLSNIIIEEIEFINSTGKAQAIYQVGEFFALRFKLISREKINDFDINFRLERSDGLVVVDRMARKDDLFDLGDKMDFCAKIPLSDLALGKGTYQGYIRIVVHSHLGDPQLVASSGAILQLENDSYPHTNPVTWRHPTWQARE